MPGYRDFLPSKECDLVMFTKNFATQLAEHYEAVGRTSEDVAVFSALNAEWREAFRVSVDPSTRTRSAVTQKRVAKLACVRKLRELAGLIQKYPGTSDALRANFMLRIKQSPSPIGTPDEIPRIVVGERTGTSVSIQLMDSAGRCAKPAGTHSARIYVFVGDEPNEGSTAGWDFYAQTSRMSATIHFPATLKPGTKVWITCAYVSPRGAVGTGCPAVSAFLAGGTIRLQERQLNRAA